MLPSGAHVKIGSHEYVLDESVDESYLHGYEPLFSNNTSIVGSQEKESTRADLIHWQFDSFEGGEGYSQFNPEDPVTYWKGTNNPRVRGSVTATPTATDGTGLSTALSETGKRFFFTSVGDRLYMASSRQVWYSTNGTSWTEHGGSPMGASGDEITGLASDENYVYVAVHTTGTGTGTRSIRRLDATAESVFVSDTASVLPLFDLAVLEGYLYGWTGRNLVKYRLNPDSTPITHADTEHKVYSPWDENIPSGGFTARMVQSEQSLFFTTMSRGQTIIYEWRKDTPTPIWKLPVGFAGNAVTTANGALYVLGDYNSRGALFGLSLATRNPLFLSYIDPASGSTDPVALAGGPGYQVLIGDTKDSSSGMVYVYDAEADGLSTLSALSSWGTVSAVVTFGQYRIVAGYSGTTAKTRAYAADTVTSGSWDWYSGIWDQGYPFATKALLGFRIVVEPLSASGTVQVYYQVDESGSWTSAGTITGAGSKSAFFQVSTGGSTIKFKSLRVRMDGTNGSKVLNLTAVSRVMDYSETWKLRLRIQDEDVASNARPSNRLAKADVLRDNIISAVTSQSLVTFLDGARYERPGQYSTHTVIIEAPRDSISRNAQGHMEVILRGVESTVTE